MDCERGERQAGGFQVEGEDRVGALNSEERKKKSCVFFFFFLKETGQLRCKGMCWVQMKGIERKVGQGGGWMWVQSSDGEAESGRIRITYQGVK